MLSQRYFPSCDRESHILPGEQQGLRFIDNLPLDLEDTLAPGFPGVFMDLRYGQDIILKKNLMSLKSSMRNREATRRLKKGDQLSHYDISQTLCKGIIQFCEYMP